MKPESICVSLETAKKLKEAGWNKETVFVWGSYAYTQDHDYAIKLETYQEWLERLNSRGSQETSTHLRMPKNSYPAPTSAEIELPDDFPDLHYWSIKKINAGNWRVELSMFSGHPTGPYLTVFENTFEVEAKAKMWLYLKERGMI
jgi:hypothetical protein